MKVTKRQWPHTVRYNVLAAICSAAAQGKPTTIKNLHEFAAPQLAKHGKECRFKTVQNVIAEGVAADVLRIEHVNGEHVYSYARKTMSMTDMCERIGAHRKEQRLKAAGHDTDAVTFPDMPRFIPPKPKQQAGNGAVSIDIDDNLKTWVTVTVDSGAEYEIAADDIRDVVEALCERFQGLA